MVKTEDAKQYQLVAKNECRRAKPKGWKAPAYDPRTGDGMIVVKVAYHLKRAMDCGNAEKLLSDAIQWALDTDDKQFLPQAIAKTTGNKHPRVEVWIE